MKLNQGPKPKLGFHSPPMHTDLCPLFFSDIKKILNLEITLSHMQPATYNYGLIPKG